MFMAAKWADVRNTHPSQLKSHLSFFKSSTRTTLGGLAAACCLAAIACGGSGDDDDDGPAPKGPKPAAELACAKPLEAMKYLSADRQLAEPDFGCYDGAPSQAAEGGQM